jgi:hypothetical protein
MNNPKDQFDIYASVKLALSNERLLRTTLSEFIAEKRKCGYKVNESTRAAFRRIPGWQVIRIANVFSPTTTVDEIVANLKRMDRDMTRGWIDPLS